MVNVTKFEALFTERNDIIDNFKKKTKIGDYLLGRTLGEGTFAKVKLAVHVPTGQRVAVKVIRKRRSNERKERLMRRIVRQEVMSHRRLRHPNIVQLYEVLETSENFYLVMELADGPKLHKVIRDRGSFSEYEGRRIFRQIVSAVHHIHCMGVVHRDLKIENILFNINTNVKLIDFGLSGVFDGCSALSTQCGSPAYTAPEIFAGKQYTSAVDIWSLGVNLYVLLTGNLPFPVDRHSNLSQLHAAILKGTALPSYLSQSCQDLLRRLLHVDAGERIAMSELMAHQWVSQDFAPLLPWEPTSRQATQQLDPTVLRYMSKKLNISEALVRDAVIRNKVNSISATYHLLSRRPGRVTPGVSQVAGERRTRLYLRGSGCDGMDKVEQRERVVPRWNRHQSVDSPAVSEVSDGSGGNGTFAGSSIGLKLSVQKNQDDVMSGIAQSEEKAIVTIDREGIITKSKPHSTTVITLPECRTPNPSVAYVVGTSMCSKTPKPSYKDCLRKLRSKRVTSPSKGILKASESFSRPESVMFSDGEAGADDWSSSVETFPLPIGSDIQKRQSSASSKSVRFSLNENDGSKSSRSRVIPTHKLKLNSNNGERLLVSRNGCTETGSRQGLSSRDSQVYTWDSYSSQSGKDKLDSARVMRPSAYLISAEHRPTAAPPNTALGGFRHNNLESRGSHQSYSSFQREPSVLSTTSSKTRKLVLDRLIRGH